MDNPKGPKIVLQDPRTSAPGLGFLLWMRKVYGDQAGRCLGASSKPRIVTFTKGWSEAYGLFLKGEADMVMSYTTSPAYHVVAEKKDNYKAADLHRRPLSPRGAGRHDPHRRSSRSLPGNSWPSSCREPFQSAMPEATG